MAMDCCAVVREELLGEFIYRHVEGAEAMASTAVESVGIHDNVSVICVTNEELHDEPAQLVEMASHLVQSCRLVVLVDSFHVPATRGKVRVQAGSSLTVCNQPQAVEL